MNQKQIAQHSEECWLLWRKNSVQRNIDLSKFSEMDVWFYAYHSGVELGRDLESKDMINALKDWAARVGKTHSDACHEMAEVIRQGAKHDA